MTIDSHVHFWKYDKHEYSWIDNNMKVLQKNYLPEDIALTLKRNNVDGCVAIQAIPSLLETRFLSELANTHPEILGVVGWCDLQSPEVNKQLDELASYRAVKGVRHIVQSEPDDFLLRKEVRRGIESLQPYGFTYDLLIYPRQLQAAVDLVRMYPEQIFIVDHCAKPNIRDKELEAWRKGITDLALYPNVYCKVSGLITEARWKEWSAGDFYPYLDVVFQAFGTNRLMFGSDWPVMLLAGIYVQWKSLVEKYMENHLPEEREAVFGQNAQRVYNL